ncbi:LpqB family beta-propeller domain-containing protein [Parafrigoribacterium humi]|uniref:LpqB family beta-propeller domain-containing protein n=1 Tax=Parafrigoribacterium humi TaxID=3144664 RepID=UPI0032F097E0
MSERIVRPGMPRRIALAGLLCSIAVALSGCVGIPSSGPVNPGISISAGGVDDGAVLIPEGPAPGAKPAQILQGFIAAFAGSQNNYAVAREFLGGDFKTEWDPRSSVLVRTGGTRTDSIGTNQMSYTITTVADVDSSGSYTRSPQSESQVLTYQFAKEKGQWRITEAPQGIVLPESTFGSVFSEQTLYFLDPTGQRLVPDRRWFPTGAQPVRIVSALLTGPPASLRGAVYSAFPDGTKLSSPLVPVQDGIAKIDLTAEALSSKANERQLMKLQLLSSLSNVPNITGIAISVGDSPLSLPSPNGATPQIEPQVDPRPLVLQKESFGFAENGKITSIPSLSQKIVALKPSAVTLGSNGTTAAVLSDAGVSLVTTGTNAVTLDDRGGLIAPSLDEDGYLWTVPAASPNAIEIFNAAGKMHTLNPALPVGSKIVSLAVSRDGARVAMYLSTDAGPRLVVSGIVRSTDQDQLPVSLVAEPVLDVTADSGSAIGATWADGLSVATLSVANGQPSVVLYQLGGPRVSLGHPDGAREIVGGNGGSSGLRVLGPDGTIQALRGSGWIGSGVQVSLIATQR